jgi:hypothetical protein
MSDPQKTDTQKTDKVDFDPQKTDNSSIDYWPEMSFDFNRVFRQIKGEPDESEDVKKLRSELNSFKTELKPWIEEVGDTRHEKLKLLRKFLGEFVFVDRDPQAKLAVNELNPMFVDYAMKKGGITIQPNEIKGLMCQLFNKDRNDTSFWYKGNNGCYYHGIRWK